MTTPTIMQDEYLVGTDASDHLNTQAGTTYRRVVAFPDLNTKTSSIVLKDQDFGDVILGLAGDDRIEGADGHDSLYGGVGNDTIYGGSTAQQYVSDSPEKIIYGLIETNFVYKYQPFIDEFELRYYHDVYISTGRDRLEGGDGNDILYGGDHDDMLMGQHGDDKLYGGKGVSNFFIDTRDVASVIFSAGGQDILYGQDGNDELDGEDGDDQLIGGAGNDLIYGGQGVVAKTNLTYTDSVRFNTRDQYMSGGKDQLYGGIGDDQINGKDDNDDLYGGAGDDILYGGESQQPNLYLTYYIIRSVIQRYAIDNHISGGDDRLFGDSGNDLIYGGDGKDQIRGGTGYDELYGGEGDDILYDDDGKDRLEGGKGNDVYVVKTIHQNIVEYTGEGTDRLEVTFDYTLSDTASFEDLTLLTGALNGAGNATHNQLTGNTGHNRLTGKDGDDVLIGLDGNDQLRGGMGNDVLRGGADSDQMWGAYGDDQYEVDHISDQVSELDGQGIDTVVSNINYTLGDFIEHLELKQSAIYGGGNILNNKVLGNDQDNQLFGFDGEDQLFGGLGDDTLDGGVHNDRLEGGAGRDILFGGSGADKLYGGDDNDVLYGGIGQDTLYGDTGNDTLYGGTLGGMLYGGAGDDYYVLNRSGTGAIDNFQGGYDRVDSYIDVSLTSQIEELRLLGSANLQGTGSILNNKIFGNTGNNILRGDKGLDLINGGAGSDTYYMLRGAEQEVIFDRDTLGVDTDKLHFHDSIGLEDLWFKQTGQDLIIQVIGTTDMVQIKNWYRSTADRIEQLTFDGSSKKILMADVQTLVNAMAAMTPPASGQLELSEAQQQQLQPVWNLVWK